MVVQEIPTGRMLKRKMEDFRDAVPIILKLKDAVALRDRHWQYLMDCTGRQFELDAEGSFALREIFDMELHRFKVGQGERSTICPILKSYSLLTHTGGGAGNNLQGN